MSRKINIIKNIGIKTISSITILVLLLFQGIIPISYAVQKTSTDYNADTGEKNNGEETDESEETEESFVDVTKCVEIAGSAEEGYYLKFIDDIDVKLQEIYDTNKVSYQNMGLKDISLFKEMIKAQIATEFPNMGGIVESSNPISNGKEAPAVSNSSSQSTSSGEITLEAGAIIWPQEELDTTILGDEDFGPRNLSYGSKYHDGIDINNLSAGSAVMSVADGTVTYAGLNGDYGYYVEVDHGNGLTTFYGHMSSDLQVSDGQKITKGQIVGFVSGTGGGGAMKYEAHLHMGCHFNGEKVDPLTTLYSDTLDINLPGANDSDVGSIQPKANSSKTITIKPAYGSSGSSSSSSYTGSQSSNNQNAKITIKDNKNINGEDKFQGGVRIRRLTPSKEIGSFDSNLFSDKLNISVGDMEGMGKASEIPNSVKNLMKKASLSGNTTVNVDDLIYLTIPYLDYDENVNEGHMIVNKSVAEDVLNIFYELYSIRYPIYSMEIVDTFYKDSSNDGQEIRDKIEEIMEKEQEASQKENKEESKKENKEAKKKNVEYTTSDRDDLGQTSADNNNTSSFYYRRFNLSSHATGNAIDINPTINPETVDSARRTEQRNAQEYVDRTKKDTWDEDAQKAFIDKESEVYKIFTKYGWTWGGDNGDYGHFEKTTTNKKSSTESVSIESKYYDLSYVSEQEFNSYVAKGDKRALYVYTLNSNKEVIFATWSYTTDNGFSISKSSPVSYKNALSKYAMPFEYLSTMLVHGRDVDFIDGLAELGQNSEYIITIQDNVTDTRTTTTTIKQVITFDENMTTINESSTNTEVTVKINETVTQKPVVTYVNNWYIKYVRKLTDDENEETINSAGKVLNETQVKVMGKRKITPSKTENKSPTQEDIVNNEGVTQRVITNETIVTDVISFIYDEGVEEITGNATKFVNLYKNCKTIVKNNIYIPWIEQSMEKYSQIENLINVTKYLFYQANKRNYKSTTLQLNDYKPDDFNSSSSTGNTANGSLSITGNTVQEKVWNALISAGYSEISTAAVMGNIAQESKWVPETTERSGPGDGGIGLIQWDDRGPTLVEFANGRGKQWQDVDIQIEFLLGELTLDPNDADGVAKYQWSGNEGNHQIWLTGDIESATEAFCSGFERAGIPNLQYRISEAKRFYNIYANK